MNIFVQHIFFLPTIYKKIKKLGKWRRKKYSDEEQIILDL